jgi:hypothetical protein
MQDGRHEGIDAVFGGNKVGMDEESHMTDLTC